MRPYRKAITEILNVTIKHTCFQHIISVLALVIIALCHLNWIPFVKYDTLTSYKGHEALRNQIFSYFRGVKPTFHIEFYINKSDFSDLTLFQA